MTLEDVLQELSDLADPTVKEFKWQRFGIPAQNSLGIYHKDLKVIAKVIGRDNELALKLFDSGIYEARILCSKIYDPALITRKQMECWVKTFDTWEICDSFCMGFFAKSNYAVEKALKWSENSGEFVKRAGFVLMACYGYADKKADNELFEQFFPIIIDEALDDRIYVRKAVNWALRCIGKRNTDLQKKSILVAKQIMKLENKTAKWIARDALKELENPNANILDYPRSIYRND